MDVLDKIALLEVPSTLDLKGLSLRQKVSMPVGLHGAALSKAVSILKNRMTLPYALKVKLPDVATHFAVTDHEFFYIYATHEQQNLQAKRSDQYLKIFNAERERLRRRTLLSVRRKLAAWELLCALDSDTFHVELLNQCPLYFRQSEILDVLMGALIAPSSKISAVELIKSITPRQRKSDAKEHARLRAETKLISQKLDYMSYATSDEDEVKATSQWLKSRYPNILERGNDIRSTPQARAIDAVAERYGIDSRYLQDSISKLNTHIKGKSATHVYYVEGLYTKWWDSFEKCRKRLPSTSHWAGIETFTWKQLIQTK